MTRVLVIGGTSLVGSHFLSETIHDVSAAGLRDPAELGVRRRDFQRLDIADGLSVDRLVEGTPADVVVNFAASTNVGAVERERARGETPDVPTSAWVLNALAPERLAKACARSGRGFVSFSTDFVFDGTTGPYDESQPPVNRPDQVSWYGWTKAEGERRIAVADRRATVVRISYPFRSHFAGKDDFARRILRWRSEGTMPPMFTDQTLTPTWIPDVTTALDHLVDAPTHGVVHVASPTLTTPFQFATELLRLVEGGAPRLTQGEAREAMRAPGAYLRPLRGGLRCERLRRSGQEFTPWETALRTLVDELHSSKISSGA